MKDITLTASSMTAISFCQKMVALSLGNEYEIQQLGISFDKRGANTLVVRGEFVVFKPEAPLSTRNPQFMFAFGMARSHGKANWGMSNKREILLGSNSPLGKARSSSHAEFRAETSVKLVLTKPFEFE